MYLRVDHTRLTTPQAAASDGDYDVVIVGSGLCGAIIAERLCHEGKRVLMLEAGPITDKSLRGYNGYLTNFYGESTKDNQAPYPENPNAQMPRSPLLRKLQPGEVDSSTYMVQAGPYVSDTTYTRTFGGTTMHWEAKTPRMLPEDFKTQTLYGQGRDWPLGYDEIEPDYQLAEREMGVSADVDALRYPGGSPYPECYVYPMQGLPLSYLDQMVDKGIKGTTVELDGETISLQVRPEAHYARMETDLHDPSSLAEAKLPLYSDLKLHFMGKALADDYAQPTDGAYSAQPGYYVTRVLWDIGDTAPYLHDGRARTLAEAIEMHGAEGSEAAPVAEKYAALSGDEQAALIVFLESQRLPVSEGISEVEYLPRNATNTP